MKETAIHQPGVMIMDIPELNGSALISSHTSVIFREDSSISPATAPGGLRYIPWGADNDMPYQVLERIEADETMSTCQLFNSEICYGAGLEYDTTSASAATTGAVTEFMEDNDFASSYMGACMDMKYFGFSVAVIILDKEGKKIVSIHRKEACYCRFGPTDSNGRIPYILYADWRSVPKQGAIEKIDLLPNVGTLSELRHRAARGGRKFAVVSRIPTPDSTYYPIPYYASLFRSKWYDIKQLIGVAKESKLRNSAPLKYHIQISNRFWQDLFKSAGLTNPEDKAKRRRQEMENMIAFLTRAENSGKAIFSTLYVSPDGKEHSDVVISRIETGKEGGDWSADIQEAVNMICFALRVHSNLVGSVPGKSQSNNSGSDKRELYTISQSLQKPYHDLLFKPHRLIIRFNGWDSVKPVCRMIQLTTLDEHRDAKTVTPE